MSPERTPYLDSTGQERAQVHMVSSDYDKPERLQIMWDADSGSFLRAIEIVEKYHINDVIDELDRETMEDRILEAWAQIVQEHRNFLKSALVETSDAPE